MLRLSSTQVTRIKEALERFMRNYGSIPPKLRYEDLVNDIRDITKEEICLTNIPRIPNEQPSVSDLLRN